MYNITSGHTVQLTLSISFSFVHCRFRWSGQGTNIHNCDFVHYWLLLDLSKLRLLVEKFLRFNALKSSYEITSCDFRLTNADWDGDNAWGVEAVEWSESDSKDVARLCIERDWVSLEFIRARRVTWTRRIRWGTRGKCGYLHQG